MAHILQLSSEVGCQRPKQVKAMFLKPGAIELEHGSSQKWSDCGGGIEYWEEKEVRV